MPTATKRNDAAAPLAKELPSEATRPESGLSRPSSLGSFQTAAGGISDHAPATSASENEDEEAEEHDNTQVASQGTMLRSHTNATVTGQVHVETVSRHHSTPRAVTAPSSEAAESSNESTGSPAIFQQNPSSDSDTNAKSPATLHQEPDSRASVDNDRKSANKALLTTGTALGPNGPAHDDGVRALHGSHLTLPYQHSDAGDHVDASGTLSKVSSSTYAFRLDPSKADSVVDDVPDTEMCDARYRSESERRGLRESRLLPSASVGDFGSLRGGASVRGGSFRGPGSRYAASYIEPASLLSGPLPAAAIRSRDSDRLSILSRSTARKPASVISRMLKADAQFPGTRIRKYVEPPLNEAMRRVMRQFTRHHMGDHRCNGYPIAVFVGATAIDTGSVIQPHISAAVSLYFGPGHPKSMASLLPEEDRIPLHIPNPKAPTPASLSRRAELRSAITALHTIYELYRGRACAHVCIDSAYVAKAWGTWIPAWENHGWPGEVDESEDDYKPWRAGYRRDQRLPSRRSRDGPANDSRRSRRAAPRKYEERDDWLSRDRYADRESRRGTAATRSPHRGGRSQYDRDSSDEDDYVPPRGGRAGRGAPRLRLVDEDLLRELADIRYDFARVERHRRGGAQLYLIDRCNNPADRMARAVAKSKGNHLAQSAAGEFHTRSQIGIAASQPGYSDEETSDQEQKWMETRSTMSSFSRSTKGGSGRNSSQGRLRTSASLPAGQLRRGPRRLLDTFLEEDEDEVPGDDARSVRTTKSRKSTRAERERHDYLARQDQIETESLNSRSASRAGRLAPPCERGSLRHSIDSRSGRMGSTLPSPDTASRRGSLDSRRRISNAKSQPSMRGSDTRPTVRSALAEAATRFSEDEEDAFGPRRHMPSDAPDMDDLVPPSRMWESGSPHSGRDSIDSRTGSPRKAVLGKSQAPPQPQSPPKGVCGLFKNSSSPSLRRMPAPEDPDYQWTKGSPKQKREWKSTTADEWGEAQETSQWEQEASKKGFFGRMFGRKK